MMLENWVPKTVFSGDRKYRYTLWRPWNGILGKKGPPVLGNWINPSTADESKNDPTTRLVLKWIRDNGYGDYIATNPFAIRGSDPAVIGQVDDPVGVDNDVWTSRAIAWVRARGGVVVVGWGNFNAGSRRERTLELLGRPIHCFGLTKQGLPHFPTSFLMRTNPRLRVYLHKRSRFREHGRP